MLLWEGESAVREGATIIIRFDIPQDIEQELSASVSDLNADAREAYLVSLYREDRITHHQLGQALGTTRLETEAVLKRHRVSSGVTAEELRSQGAAFREGLGGARAR